MKQTEPVIALAEQEWRALERGLRERWLSGRYCQAGDPFRAEVHPVVFEEFGFWRHTLKERLEHVLAAKAQERFFALEYMSGDGEIEFTGGHSVRAGLPHADYERIGNEVGFALNGMEFHLCDATGSWTIGSTVDIQFAAGDESFWESYLSSPRQRQAAIDGFLALIAGDRIRPEFKRMKEYLRNT